MDASKIIGYDGIFATRLRDLMKNAKATQQDVAAAVGTTRQAISQYADGSVQPNIEKLYKIADYFKVSSDYLLGLSDVKTTDTIIHDIHKKTGLSEEVIDTLECEMRLLYGMTNTTTPQKAFESFLAFQAFVNAKERTDDELYEYAQKNGISKEYRDENDPTVQINLFNFSRYTPNSYTINSIMHDYAPLDDNYSISVMDALYDVISFNKTEKLYVISEFVDEYDAETGHYVESRIVSDMLRKDFLYSSDLYSMKLLNLQQAFIHQQKYKDLLKHSDGKQ